MLNTTPGPINRTPPPTLRHALLPVAAAGPTRWHARAPPPAAPRPPFCARSQRRGRGRAGPSRSHHHAVLSASCGRRVLQQPEPQHGGAQHPQVTGASPPASFPAGPRPCGARTGRRHSGAPRPSAAKRGRQPPGARRFNARLPLFNVVLLFFLNNGHWQGALSPLREHRGLVLGSGREGVLRLWGSLYAAL